MVIVQWTFKFPSPISKAEFVRRSHETAHLYRAAPGLIRKYYGLAEDGGSFVGIYLWETRAAAEAFYTADWIKLVSGRWHTTPTRQTWDALMVIDNWREEIVAAE